MLLLPPLLLLLSRDPQLQLLPAGMLVISLSVISASITTTLAPVENFPVPIVVRRGTQSDSAKLRPNRPINLREQALVKPATTVVKLGTLKGTALRSLLLTTPEGSSPWDGRKWSPIPLLSRVRSFSTTHMLAFFLIRVLKEVLLVIHSNIT